MSTNAAAPLPYGSPSVASSSSTFAVPAYQLHPASPAGKKFTPASEKRYRNAVRSRGCWWCSCALCAVCLVLLVLISVSFGAFLLWASKVKVNVVGIVQPTNGIANVWMLSPQTLAVNVTLKIDVRNDNSKGLTLDQVTGDGFVRVSGGDPRLIATGSQSNIVIPPKASTQILFPVTAVYGDETDPGRLALRELVTRCGLVNPAQKSKVPMEFHVNVRAKMAGLRVAVSFTQDADLDCPLPAGTSNPMLDQVVAEVRAGGASGAGGPPPKLLRRAAG